MFLCPFVTDGEDFLLSPLNGQNAKFFVNRNHGGVIEIVSMAIDKKNPQTVVNGNMFSNDLILIYSMLWYMNYE